MTTEKKYTNALAAGDVIDYDGPRTVASTFDYGNGWWVINTEDGTSIDALGYRAFDLHL